MIDKGRSAAGDGTGTSASGWSQAEASSRRFQGMCALFKEHEVPLG
jgi:hypothetical protein